MSWAAMQMRRRGLLVWGIILPVVWTAITVPVTLNYGTTQLDRIAGFIAIQAFVGL